MADHLDAPGLKSPNMDASIDICDLFVFQKPGDPSRTVLIMDVNPVAPTFADAFAAHAVYELKVDTNGDAVAEIAFRVSFSPKENGRQTATLRRAEGAQAAGSGNEGEVIFSDVPVAFGQEISSAEADGYRFFAGIRSDPFFFDLEGYKNGMRFTGADTFLDKNVFSIVLELPNRALGERSRLGIWARVLIPKDGEPFFQIDRMAHPLLNIVITQGEDKNRFNRIEPTRDRELFGATFSAFFVASGRSPEAAQEAAHSLLPDILAYDYARPTSYRNGRRLTDDIIDTQLALFTNGKVTTDLVGPHQDLLADFPYVGPPHL